MKQRTARAVLSLAVPVALGGCAGPRDGIPPPEPRPLGADLAAFQAPEDPEIDLPAPSRDEPEGDLTLADALALALMRSPDLAVFSWEVRAREARELQAGLRPNPVIALEVENLGAGAVSGLDGAETTVSLSQLVELGGKRAKRGRLAAVERHLAMWDYETRRLDVLTRVTNTFVDLLAAQERLWLAEELVELDQEILADVSRRVQAGAVSPVEETRARVELSTCRLDRSAAEREVLELRVRLAALWGNPDPGFARAAGSLEHHAPPPDRQAVLEHSVQGPDVARWEAERRRREADLALQRALGVPDIDVGAGVRRLGESSEVGLVLGLSVPLPVFDRNQGARREASVRLARAREEERSHRVQARADLAVAYEALTGAHQEITSLEREVLPEAAKALATARDAHGRGLFRFTDFLDTQRTLFELRGRRFDALARYHRAAAQIERLTGRPLSAIGGNDAAH